MISVRRWLSLLCLCPAILTAEFAVGFDGPVQDQGHWQVLQRTSIANQSLHAFMAAKLELEQFNLRNRAELLKRGQASWLEVARQQVLVDSLASQLHSLERFSQSLQDWSGQLNPPADSVVDSAADSNRDAGIVVTVYRPGSLRLLGWLEHDPSGEADLIASPGDLDAQPESPVQMARRGFEQKRARYQRLLDTEPGSVFAREQARLQMQLARSELELLEWKHSAAFQMGGSSELGGSSVSRAGDATISRLRTLRRRTPHRGDALHRATHRLALAEAKATAFLDAATIQVVQAQDRLDAVAQRHGEGFLSNATVKQSAEYLADVISHRQHLASQSARRADAYRLVKHDQESVAVEHVFDSRLDNDIHWPPAVLQHPARLSYLIDLCRQYFSLEGQLAAYHHQLRFRREQRRRLEHVAQSMTDNEHAAAATNGLQQSLAAGHRCERQQLSREIQYLEEYARGIGQQMAIVALEERRFVAQLEQIRKPDAFGIGKLLQPAAMTATMLQQRGRVDCFLASDVDTEDRNLVMVRYVPEYFAFDFVRERARTPRLKHALPLSFAQAVTPVANQSGSRTLYRSRDGQFDRQVSVNTPAFTARSDEDRNRFRLGPSSSHVIYPNGILRPELRHRLPAGYSPWYLPGSPTNLQH